MADRETEESFDIEPQQDAMLSPETFANDLKTFRKEIKNVSCDVLLIDAFSPSRSKSDVVSVPVNFDDSLSTFVSKLVEVAPSLFEFVDHWHRLSNEVELYDVWMISKLKRQADFQKEHNEARSISYPRRKAKRMWEVLPCFPEPDPLQVTKATGDLDYLLRAHESGFYPRTKPNTLNGKASEWTYVSGEGQCYRVIACLPYSKIPDAEGGDPLEELHQVITKGTEEDGEGTMSPAKFRELLGSYIATGSNTIRSPVTFHSPASLYLSRYCSCVLSIREMDGIPGCDVPYIEFCPSVSPLHIAIVHGNTPLVQSIFASPSMRAGELRTSENFFALRILAFAAEVSPSMVPCLVKLLLPRAASDGAGADAEWLSNDLISMLLFSSSVTFPDTIRNEILQIVIREHSHKLTLRDVIGLTALDYIAMMGPAWAEGNKALIKAVLSSSAAVEWLFCDEHAMSPAAHAMSHGNFQFVDLCLEHFSWETVMLGECSNPELRDRNARSSVHMGAVSRLHRMAHISVAKTTIECLATWWRPRWKWRDLESRQWFVAFKRKLIDPSSLLFNDKYKSVVSSILDLIGLEVNELRFIAGVGVEDTDAHSPNTMGLTPLHYYSAFAGDEHDPRHKACVHLLKAAPTLLLTAPTETLSLCAYAASQGNFAFLNLCMTLNPDLSWKDILLGSCKKKLELVTSFRYPKNSKREVPVVVNGSPCALSLLVRWWRKNWTEAFVGCRSHSWQRELVSVVRNDDGGDISKDVIATHGCVLLEAAVALPLGVAPSEVLQFASRVLKLKFQQFDTLDQETIGELEKWWGSVKSLLLGLPPSQAQSLKSAAVSFISSFAKKYLGSLKGKGGSMAIARFTSHVVTDMISMLARYAFGANDCNDTIRQVLKLWLAVKDAFLETDRSSELQEMFVGIHFVAALPVAPEFLQVLCDDAALIPFPLTPQVVLHFLKGAAASTQRADVVKLLARLTTTTLRGLDKAVLWATIVAIATGRALFSVSRELFSLSGVCEEIIAASGDCPLTSALVRATGAEGKHVEHQSVAVSAEELALIIRITPAHRTDAILEAFRVSDAVTPPQRLPLDSVTMELFGSMFAYHKKCPSHFHILAMLTLRPHISVDSVLRCWPDWLAAFSITAEETDMNDGEESELQIRQKSAFLLLLAVVQSKWRPRTIRNPSHKLRDSVPTVTVSLTNLGMPLEKAWRRIFTSKAKLGFQGGAEAVSSYLHALRSLPHLHEMLCTDFFSLSTNVALATKRQIRTFIAKDRKQHHSYSSDELFPVVPPSPWSVERSSPCSDRWELKQGKQTYHAKLAELVRVQGAALFWGENKMDALAEAKDHNGEELYVPQPEWARKLNRKYRRNLNYCGRLGIFTDAERSKRELLLVVNRTFLCSLPVWRQRFPTELCASSSDPVATLLERVQIDHTIQPLHDLLYSPAWRSRGGNSLPALQELLSTKDDVSDVIRSVAAVPLGDAVKCLISSHRAFAQRPPLQRMMRRCLHPTTLSMALTSFDFSVPEEETESDGWRRGKLRLMLSILMKHEYWDVIVELSEVELLGDDFSAAFTRSMLATMLLRCPQELLTKVVTACPALTERLLGAYFTSTIVRCSLVPWVVAKLAQQPDEATRHEQRRTLWVANGAVECSPVAKALKWTPLTAADVKQCTSKEERTAIVKAILLCPFAYEHWSELLPLCFEHGTSVGIEPLDALLKLIHERPTAITSSAVQWQPAVVQSALSKILQYVAVKPDAEVGELGKRCAQMLLMARGRLDDFKMITAHLVGPLAAECEAFATEIFTSFRKYRVGLSWVIGFEEGKEIHNLLAASCGLGKGENICPLRPRDGETDSVIRSNSGKLGTITVSRELVLADPTGSTKSVSLAQSQALGLSSRPQVFEFPRNLSVTIVRCKKLLNLQTFGTSDPYVIAFNLDGSSKAHTTPVMESTLNPSFPPAKSVYIVKLENQLGNLKFHVMEKETTFDKFMGEAVIDIVSVLSQRELGEIEIPLRPRPNEPDKDIAEAASLGSLFIKAQYEKVNVNVQKEVQKYPCCIVVGPGGADDSSIVVDLGDCLAEQPFTPLTLKEVASFRDFGNHRISLHTKRAHRNVLIQTIRHGECTEDDIIGMLSTRTGECRALKDVTTVVAISADCTRIAGCTLDCTVRVWDIATGVVISETAEHSAPIKRVAFSPDGAMVASCAKNTVYVWDSATGRTLQLLEGHTDEVLAIAFSLDNNQIASGGEDKVVRVWNVSSGVQILSLEGHSRGVTSIAFSADGFCLISGSNDSTAQRWSLARGGANEGTIGQHHDSLVTCVLVSPDSDHVVIGTVGRAMELRMWSRGVAECSFRGRISLARKNIVCAFSPDGSMFANNGEKAVQLWKVDLSLDVATAKESFLLSGHSRVVTAMQFSPDGSRLITVGSDRHVIEWDVKTGTIIHRIRQTTVEELAIVTMQHGLNSYSERLISLLLKSCKPSWVAQLLLAFGDEGQWARYFAADEYNELRCEVKRIVSDWFLTGSDLTSPDETGLRVKSPLFSWTDPIAAKTAKMDVLMQLLGNGPNGDAIAFRKQISSALCPERQFAINNSKSSGGDKHIDASQLLPLMRTGKCSLTEWVSILELNVVNLLASGRESDKKHTGFKLLQGTLLLCALETGNHAYAEAIIRLNKKLLRDEHALFRLAETVMVFGDVDNMKAFLATYEETGKAAIATIVSAACSSDVQSWNLVSHYYDGTPPKEDDDNCEEQEEKEEVVEKGVGYPLFSFWRTPADSQMQKVELIMTCVEEATLPTGLTACTKEELLTKLMPSYRLDVPLEWEDRGDAKEDPLVFESSDDEGEEEEEGEKEEDNAQPREKRTTLPPVDIDSALQRRCRSMFTVEGLVSALNSLAPCDVALLFAYSDPIKIVTQCRRNGSEADVARAMQLLGEVANSHPMGQVQEFAKWGQTLLRPRQPSVQQIPRDLTERQISAIFDKIVPWHLSTPGLKQCLEKLLGLSSSTQRRVMRRYYFTGVGLDFFIENNLRTTLAVVHLMSNDGPTRASDVIRALIEVERAQNKCDDSVGTLLGNTNALRRMGTSSACDEGMRAEMAQAVGKAMQAIAHTYSLVRKGVVTSHLQRLTAALSQADDGFLSLFTPCGNPLLRLAQYVRHTDTALASRELSAEVAVIDDVLKQHSSARVQALRYWLHVHNNASDIPNPTVIAKEEALRNKKRNAEESEVLHPSLCFLKDSRGATVRRLNRLVASSLIARKIVCNIELKHPTLFFTHSGILRPIAQRPIRPSNIEAWGKAPIAAPQYSSSVAKYIDSDKQGGSSVLERLSQLIAFYRLSPEKWPTNEEMSTSIEMLWAILAHDVPILDDAGPIRRRNLRVKGTFSPPYDNRNQPTTARSKAMLYAALAPFFDAGELTSLAAPLSVSSLLPTFRPPGPITSRNYVSYDVFRATVNDFRSPPVLVWTSYRFLTTENPYIPLNDILQDDAYHINISSIDDFLDLAQDQDRGTKQVSLDMTMEEVYAQYMDSEDPEERRAAFLWVSENVGKKFFHPIRLLLALEVLEHLRQSRLGGMTRMSAFTASFEVTPLRGEEGFTVAHVSTVWDALYFLHVPLVLLLKCILDCERRKSLRTIQMEARRFWAYEKFFLDSLIAKKRHAEVVEALVELKELHDDDLMRDLLSMYWRSFALIADEEERRLHLLMLCLEERLWPILLPLPLTADEAACLAERFGKKDGTVDMLAGDTFPELLLRHKLCPSYLIHLSDKFLFPLESLFAGDETGDDSHPSPTSDDVNRSDIAAADVSVSVEQFTSRLSATIIHHNCLIAWIDVIRACPGEIVCGELLFDFTRAAMWKAFEESRSVRTRMSLFFFSFMLPQYCPMLISPDEPPHKNVFSVLPSTTPPLPNETVILNVLDILRGVSPVAGDRRGLLLQLFAPGITLPQVVAMGHQAGLFSSSTLSLLQGYMNELHKGSQALFFVPKNSVGGSKLLTTIFASSHQSRDAAKSLEPPTFSATSDFHDCQDLVLAEELPLTIQASKATYSLDDERREGGNAGGETNRYLAVNRTFLSVELLVVYEISCIDGSLLRELRTLRKQLTLVRKTTTRITNLSTSHKNISYLLSMLCEQYCGSKVLTHETEELKFPAKCQVALLAQFTTLARKAIGEIADLNQERLNMKINLDTPGAPAVDENRPAVAAAVAVVAIPQFLLAIEGVLRCRKQIPLFFRMLSVTMKFRTHVPDNTDDLLQVLERIVGSSVTPVKAASKLLNDVKTVGEVFERLCD